MTYRGERFNRIKPAYQPRIEDAIRRNRVRVLWKTNVVAIGEKSVTYRNGSTETLPNDVVAVLAGGELPFKFLETCGVKVDVKFGHP